MPLYSVAKPATSSDSASGRSNGVRLPSASADDEEDEEGDERERVVEQEPVPRRRSPAPRMMPCMLSVPVSMTIGKIERPAGIS